MADEEEEEKEKVTWQMTRALAAITDITADSMSTPDYDKLLEDNTTPFPLTNVLQSGSIYYYFNVTSTHGSGGTYPMVSSQYIGDASAVPIKLDEPMKTMAGLGELFFVLDADGCLCKTIFKVEPANMDKSSFKLVTLIWSDPGTGCCQTLDMPTDGSLLDRSQYIVPSGLAALYNLDFTLTPGRGYVNFEEKRCKSEPNLAAGKLGGMEFKMKEIPRNRWNRNYTIHSIRRKISGTYVWAIRADWYQTVKERVDYILKFGNNEGAYADTVYKNGSDEFVPEHCPVSFEDLQWTMQKNDPGTQVPGCMSSPGKYPWKVATCSGTSCWNGSGAGGPKIYKASLEQFQQLVNDIPSQVYPYDPEEELGKCKPYVVASETVCDCEGYPKTFDLTPYQSPYAVSPVKCSGDRRWRLVEVGASGGGATPYGSGEVDPDTGELVGLQDSFTTHYNYPGYMELQVGVDPCPADNNPHQTLWP